MNLDDYLGPKPSVIDLRARDRWEAIDELVGHLAVTNKIKLEHRDRIATAVKQRERSMSTGIGFEIGIPHASSDLVSDVVAVVGRSQNGIQFDALDGKPVKSVLSFCRPRPRKNMQHRPHSRRRLRHAKSPNQTGHRIGLRALFSRAPDVHSHCEG